MDTEQDTEQLEEVYVVTLVTTEKAEAFDALEHMATNTSDGTENISFETLLREWKEVPEEDVPNPSGGAGPWIDAVAQTLDWPDDVTDMFRGLIGRHGR